MDKIIEVIKECAETLFTDIKAFVTHTPKKEHIQTKIQKLTYPERASGDISVDIKETKLRELMISIQKIIKAKNDT